ncbi:MAG: SIS domain-containing protein, partial [Anaerolineae bacterium]
IQELLDRIVDTQMDRIREAATIVADTVAGDGILYTFGTGHSHVIAEDVAYRAGGLAPVDAILEPSLTGHTQVVKSEYMERVEGMAEVILDYYRVSSEDALLVISNSGRNAAPIEMAQIGQAREIPVIAITSLAHSTGTTSRHSSGKKLYQVADVVIDNCVPKGDCTLHLEGMAQPIGPASGVTGMFIIHTIIVQAIQNLKERGVEPPVFMSGNIDGSDEFNAPLLEAYEGRIKLW